MIPTEYYQDYINLLLVCAFPYYKAGPELVVRRSLLYHKFPELRVLASFASECFPEGYLSQDDHVANEKFKLCVTIMSDDFTGADFLTMENILYDCGDRGSIRKTKTAAKLGNV